MKLQTALWFLALVVITAASTLASYGAAAAARRGVCSASSHSVTETRSERVELAATGYQVGQSQA